MTTLDDIDRIADGHEDNLAPLFSSPFLRPSASPEELARHAELERRALAAMDRVVGKWFTRLIGCMPVTILLDVDRFAILVPTAGVGSPAEVLEVPSLSAEMGVPAARAVLKVVS